MTGDTPTTDRRCAADEFLEELEQHATAVLAGDYGLESDAARQAAARIAAAVRDAWAGNQVYFPKAPNLTDRDLEIAERFDGRNRLALCREYGITARRLYQIVQEVRRSRSASRPSTRRRAAAR